MLKFNLIETRQEVATSFGISRSRVPQSVPQEDHGYRPGRKGQRMD